METALSRDRSPSSEPGVDVSWNRASTPPTLATSRSSPRSSPPAGSS